MNILTPDSKATRSEQYAKAWKDLTNDAADPDAIAHAKCWLTYRAVDGEVKLADWMEKINLVVAYDGSLRWTVSQATAEAYLYKLVANDDVAFDSCLRKVTFSVRQSGLQTWPGASLNFLRCSALLAYRRLLAGDANQAENEINSAMGVWANLWDTFDFRVHPFRFAEMRGDCVVLHAMQFMLQRMGAIKPVHMLDAEWSRNILKADKDQPWWRCIEKLSREKTLW